MIRTQFQNAAIVNGAGALDELRGSAVGARVLVVSGRHVADDPQLRGRVADLLGQRLIGWETVMPFPSEAGVDSVLMRLRALSADSVVAIGGGSVVDAGKTAAVLAASGLTVRDAMAGKLVGARKKLHTVAVPTLAGTGSEVTPFAVLYADGKKFSLESPLLQPDLVLADPDLVLLPPAPAASAALLDALAQAVESLWAVRATPESEEHAWSCLRAITAFSMHHPDARAALTNISLESGMAIAVSRTTAAHALSYPLTIRFGVPHGIACAALLPAVLAWNAEVDEKDCVHPGGAVFVRNRIADIRAHVDGVGGIRGIAERLGASLELRSYGVGPGDLDALTAACGNPERLGNNPRRVPREAIPALYRQSM